MPPGRIQQPRRRHRVDADRIHPTGRHASEVSLDDVYGGIFVTIVVGTERPIGHAAGIQLVIAGEDELAPCGRRNVYVGECGDHVRAAATRTELPAVSYACS